MSKEKPYSPLLEAKATLEVFRKKKKKSARKWMKKNAHKA